MRPPNDVFSKRNLTLPDVFTYDVLPEKLRVQLYRHFDRHAPNMMTYESQMFPVDEEYKTAVDAICDEHGIENIVEPLSNRRPSSARYELLECIKRNPSTKIALDAIEQLCRVFRVAVRSGAVREYMLPEIYRVVNYRFLENGVGYSYVPEQDILIRIDSTLLHQSAIAPSLVLLNDPHFSTANSEFITAFDDYKKGDYDDCAVKSCSAFESTLKVICTRKGWAFDPNKDTCSKLVETVVKNGNLDSFLTEPFKLIGSIRNKLSAAHGGGTSQRVVTEEMARYCLNSTASAILYMVEATR